MDCVRTKFARQLTVQEDEDKCKGDLFSATGPCESEDQFNREALGNS